MLQKVFLRLTRARRFRSGMIALCAIGAIVLVAVGASPLLALGTVNMRVDPVTRAVPVNGTFTVDIVADVSPEMDTNGLGAYEFDLVYDPNYLEVDSVGDAGGLGSTSRTVSGLGPNIDNPNGRTTFAAYSSPPEDVSGPGTTVVLATVTLRAKRAGVTTLTLENALMADTQANAWPDAGAGHVLNVEDGTVTVIQPGTEYWFPWYDNWSMTTWLMVGNSSQTETAEVDIYIADMSTPKSHHSIPPGDRATPQYALLDGPGRVVSTNGVNVFVTERMHFADNTDFNETVGGVIP